jgi:hypothetical protein
MVIQCDDCLRTFNNENAFKCHRTRQSKLSVQNKCGYKRRLKESIAQRDIAKVKLLELDSAKLLEVAYNYDKNNELEVQNNELEVQLKLKNEEIEQLKSNSFQSCKLPQSIIARRSMTEPERRLVLEKQENKCSGINCKLTSMSGHPYDIDHKIPIQFGGTDEHNNLQALCTECHRNKTDFERTLKTILENGGSQSVVFPDSWPHIIPNALYSKHITSPIVIYTS